MKNLYLIFLACFLTVFLFGQNPNNSHTILGSCLNPDEGTVKILIDLNQNCPEADPNGVLVGASEIGFHSGVNDWATILAWDDPNAVTLMNNGNDTFELTLNTMDYWGVPFGDISNLRLIGNNGIADPDNAWDVFIKDSLDAELFGNLEDCSDLMLHFDQTPTCADLNQRSSLILFSDAGDSETCVDAENGLIRIDMDYSLACPESDSTMALAGAPTIGFHSGANDWAEIVNWDADNAVQLVNDGNDNFSAIINVEAYYGLALDQITDIQMLGNNGPNAPTAAWDNKLEDPKDGGAFGNPTPCSNIALIIEEAPSCDLSVNTQDLVLKHSLRVSPNPLHNRAFIHFDNPNNAEYTLVVTNMTGQVVRTETAISDERYLFERNALPTGMYFATLYHENGNYATTKLVIK